MKRLTDMISLMVQYYGGDPKRIQHFLKVWSFAKIIGEQEGLDECTQYILEVSAITHDIGIHVAEEKYKSTSGMYQQIEGPRIADMLLLNLGFDRSVMDRVHFLIAHHHTYTEIADIDHQILVEADFLVNAFEDSLDSDTVRNFRDKVFKTRTGIKLLNDMYDLNTPEDEEKINSAP